MVSILYVEKITPPVALKGYHTDHFQPFDARSKEELAYETYIERSKKMINPLL